MTTDTNNTESNNNQNQTQNNQDDSQNNSSGYVDPNAKKEDEKKSEGENNSEENTDNFGYDDLGEKKPEGKKDDEKKSEDDKTSEDEKVKDPATGYDDADEKPDEKKSEDDKKPDDKKPEDDDKRTDEEKLKESIEGVLGDLPDREDISKFAVEHKLSKEQVKAYVELRKSEIAEYQQNLVETRKGWTQELKNDSEFGGENFNLNVDRVERLLEEHMPNTKKALTDKGGMLPPYHMKDLLSLYKTLNPTTELETGEPSELVKKESGNFLETMYE